MKTPRILAFVSLFCTINMVSPIATARLSERVYDVGLTLVYRFYDLEKQTIQLADHQVTYLHNKPKKKSNSDVETILFLHGFASNKDSWLQLIKYLHKDYIIIMLDLPGHGESEANPSASYDLEQQAARIEEFAKKLKLTSFHLIGHSMGGGIALSYAAHHPDKVKTLTLISPAVSETAVKSTFFQALDQGNNLLLVKNPGDFNHFIDLITYQKPIIPWPVKSTLETQMRRNYSINKKIFADLLRSRDEYQQLGKLPQLLQNLSMPTLLIWGTHDDVLDISGAEAIQAYVAELQFMPYDKIGHCPPIENPKRVAKDYRAFLKTHTP